MWLLDVNLPNGLLGILRGLGIDCDTTVTRGWRDLGNGVLASTAFAAGFRVILTRDRVFGDSAGRAIKAFPELAVVIVTIPQARHAVYLQRFTSAWGQSPIVPQAGKVIQWPVS